jgi:hypothetical protein
MTEKQAEYEAAGTVPVPPLDSTTAPAEKILEKPEEVHARTNSLSSQDTLGAPEAAKDAESKPERPGLERTVTIEYPPVRQQAVVMCAILLAVFLIALVSTFPKSRPLHPLIATRTAPSSPPPSPK